MPGSAFCFLQFVITLSERLEIAPNEADIVKLSVSQQ